MGHQQQHHWIRLSQHQKSLLRGNNQIRNWLGAEILQHWSSGSVLKSKYIWNINCISLWIDNGEYHTKVVIFAPMKDKDCSSTVLWVSSTRCTNRKILQTIFVNVSDIGNRKSKTAHFLQLFWWHLQPGLIWIKSWRLVNNNTSDIFLFLAHKKILSVQR